MFVKVAPIGEATQEFNLEEGITVGEALAKANVEVNGRQIKLDGNIADVDTTITGNGTTTPHYIVLSVKQKGGYIS